MGSPVISTNLIASGTMSGSTEQFIDLSNGCFARKIGWDPSNWFRLRVGIRYRITHDPTQMSPTDTPRYGLGFCVGTENIPGDPYTQLAMGGFWNDPSPTPIANLTGSLMWDVYSSTALNMSMMVIATGSYFYKGSTGNHCYYPTLTSSAAIMMVDIVKYGINNGIFTGSIGIFTRNTLTTDPDAYVSDAAFISALDTPSPTALLPGYSYDVPVSFNLNFGTYGYPDSIFIWGPRSYPKFQVTDIYVVKHSI